MSPKVPAPSKGALRALRHLALGTTCTVAFSTAVITEDRRRRIGAAHVVNENKKILKALSRYHSSGLATSADFEEDVIKYGYFPREGIHRVLEAKWSDTPPVENENEVDAMPHSSDAAHQPKDERKIRQDRVNERYEALKLQNQSPAPSRIPTLNDNDLPKLRTLPQQNPVPMNPASRNQAIEPTLSDKAGIRKVALKTSWSRKAQIMNESLDVHNVKEVDSVAETFLDLVHGEWRGRSLGKAMVTFGQKLCNACIHHQRMHHASKILEALCQSTVMDEGDFMSCHPEEILEYITSKSMFQYRGSASFKRAVTIFSTTLGKKPEFQYPNMAAIGQRICKVAFQAKDYDLLDKVFWRTQAWCPGNTTISVQMLILAQHEMENHKKVVDYFIRLLPKNDPTFATFFNTARIAVGSSLSLGSLPKAEATLEVAADISRNQGYPLPEVLLLRVLRDHWMVMRDFTSLQALFERLEKHLDILQTPARLYALMIQLCIEADHINDVQQYIDKSALHSSSDECDLWIRGNLALVKAMTGDWPAVEDEFREMSEQLHKLRSKEDRLQMMRASFTPILKLFIKHHDVTQTEEFLHRYINNYQVVPNEPINNMMIGVYVNSKELDSIPEWLKYARSKGLDLNATSFNMLLQGLKTRWTLFYPGLYRIYAQVKALDESLVNEETLRLLGTSTLETTCYKTEARTRLAKRALKAPHDSHSVKYAMNLAMSEGEFQEALTIYRVAKQNKIWLPNSVLDLAIEAVRQIGGAGAADQVVDLLADAQRDGQDIVHTLPRYLVEQLRDANMQNRDVGSLFREADMKLAERGISLPIQVVTEAAAILVQRGHFRSALDLWLYVCRKPDIEPYTLDLPILTVLLKAYVGLFDCDGIRWVIKTLIEHKIKSDKQFRRVLRDAAKSIKRRLAINPHMEYLKIMLGVLQECLDAIHDWSVVPAIEARKEARKQVLEIMMSVGAQVQGNQAAEQNNTTKKDEVTKMDEAMKSREQEIGRAESAG